MTASEAFTCPACGAEFDVQERLEEPAATAPREATVELDRSEVAEPVSFQCPACGADYDTQEQLGDEDVTTPSEAR